MHKYKPLIFTSVFAIGGLIIALFLLFTRYLIDGGEFITIFLRMQGFIFLAVAAISLGLLASEINFFMKSDIFSSVLFGMSAPLVYIGMLLLDSLLFDGAIKSMPVEFYLTIYALGSLLLGGVFYGTLRKSI